MKLHLPTMAAVTALILAGCAANDANPSAAAAGATALSTTVHPERWPAPTWPQQADPATEQRIAAIIARMSVEEKVGQVIQADIGSVTPEDVRRYHLGSILNGGNGGPGGDEYASPAAWLALADAFYDASVDTTGGRVGVPIIWGTDAVHGHSNIVGATLFPHNIGLGAARDPDLIERIARATALEIRTTGQEWTFAPTVTVPQDPRWGRFYEGYSSDPAVVSAYTERMIRGLQGPGSGTNLLAGPYVIASTKHFLADGGTFEGRDQGDARISEETLRTVHGAPYVPAIENGVATIMVSFSSWNGVKMSGNRALLTDVLRERMNFGGIVITDWNAHGQVEGCTNASCPQAINAGVDMYMAPDTWRQIHESLTRQVRSGEVPMARLDDAVARVLRVKMRLGLFEAGRPSARRYSGQWDLLGHADHRAIAREAVRESLVLLKHEGNVLPLSPRSHVLIAGDAADDVARQSGGWTLTWQGTDVDNSRFPGATSIRSGIEQALRAGGGSSEYAPDGTFTRRPDAAIVVFGETPYAEFQGDLPALQLREELRRPYATMQRLRAQGIPVIAVMLSGRPLFVNPELNVADAFVAAWLPGSEGGGIADVLIGDAARRPRFDFVGRLPGRWPATAVWEGPTLYPFGYGLTMAQRSTAWRRLSEDSGTSAMNARGGWFTNGVPAASWSLRVGTPGGDNARVMSVPMAALGGRMQVAAVNSAVQEGARQFTISEGPALVELDTITPIDLARESNADVLLSFTMRLDRRPTGAVRLGMNNTFIPFTELAAAPIGEWVTFTIPIKCFTGQGMNAGRVQAPFRLETSGSVQYSLAAVQMATVSGAQRTIACPR